MRAVSYLVAIAALVLDPIAGCELETHYDYGAKEIHTALAGTWTATVGTQSVKFAVDFGKAERHGSRGLVRPAAACSHRRWVSTAEACGDSTNVELKLIAIQGEAPQEARFVDEGTRFERGELMMRIGGEYVSAQVLASGAVEDVYGAKLVHEP